MKEFLILIGQIILITCIQSITEMIVDSGKNPYQAKLISIACFAGGLYLLLQFVFDFVMREITTVLNFQL